MIPFNASQSCVEPACQTNETGIYNVTNLEAFKVNITHWISPALPGNITRYMNDEYNIGQGPKGTIYSLRAVAEF